MAIDDYEYECEENENENDGNESKSNGGEDNLTEMLGEITPAMSVSAVTANKDGLHPPPNYDQSHQSRSLRQGTGSSASSRNSSASRKSSDGNAVDIQPTAIIRTDSSMQRQRSANNNCNSKSKQLSKTKA